MRSARGTIAIWAALSVAFLLGFVALVVNGGHVMTVKAELQNGVDAAALAAARQLGGNAEEITPPGGSPAEAAARTLASLHTTDRADVPIALDRLVLGQWRSRSGCEEGDTPGTYTDAGGAHPLQDSGGAHFCEVTARDGAAALRINAVYVRARRAGGAPGGGAVPVFMSPLMGTATRDTADVSNEAIAVAGGPIGNACIRVPMVIGVGCLTALSGGGSACPWGAPADSPGPMYALGASNARVRAMGWSLLTSPLDACGFMQAGVAGCVGDLATSVRASVGVAVEGNRFGTTCSGGTVPICELFRPRVGELIEVPVVSQTGDLGEACPPSYDRPMTVVGFATMRVLAANCPSGCHDDRARGGPASCADTTQPCATAPGGCVLTQLVCNHEARADQSTGGAWTGTSTFHPRLVQSRGAVAP